MPGPILLQSARDLERFQQESGNFVFWMIVLACLIVGLGVLAHLVRKWSQQQNEESTATAFTLADLRRMRREGVINDAQFEKLKETIIATAGYRPDDESGEPSSPEEAMRRQRKAQQRAQEQGQAGVAATGSSSASGQDDPGEEAEGFLVIDEEPSGEPGGGPPLKPGDSGMGLLSPEPPDSPDSPDPSEEEGPAPDDPTSGDNPPRTS